jgi:hypothetical protein
LVLIVFSVVFPRFLRGGLIALAVFVGVAWLIGSAPDKTMPPRHESRPRASPLERLQPSLGALANGARVLASDVSPTGAGMGRRERGDKPKRKARPSGGAGRAKL